jgi:1-acyl-sn-glycerol-3-phosphate acyltransferase
MIEARSSRWAEAVFLPYVQRLMTRSFHSVRLLGEPPDPPREKPVLIVANHVTWWDGFFIYMLNARLLHRKLHVMMLEEQLRRYRFFSRLGAFGIAQGHPRSVRASLAYSAGILQNPSHCLCIFPQGSMHRAHDRPLGFKRGVEMVLTMYGGEASILPVAIACEFLSDRKPEAFLLADRTYAVRGNAFQGREWLERLQESQMDRLDAMIGAREAGRILVGRSGSEDSR